MVNDNIITEDMYHKVRGIIRGEISHLYCTDCKKHVNDSTSLVVKEEIGGLYSSIPECSNCGQRRFMIPHSYDGRPNGTHNWTYWCSNCDTETEIEKLKEE